MMGTLPSAGSHPVVARLTNAESTYDVAVTDDADARINVGWGMGETSPVVSGPAKARHVPTPIAADALAKHAGRGAALLWAGRNLDGSLAGFGGRFWDALARVAPLAVGAVKTAGLARITYKDRYLVTPVAVALLGEVIDALPVCERIEIKVSDPEKNHRPLRRINDTFETVEALLAFIGARIPRADASAVSRKGDLPHFRVLELSLADGRTVRVLLDQGFGTWRAEGSVLFRFSDPAAAQVRDLSLRGIRIAATNETTSPIGIETLT